MEFPVAGMSYSIARIRWRRLLGAAFAVIALSFLVLIVIITVYAFVLAFKARGAPDQTAINHFAASVSPKLMPWLEMVLTLFLTFRVARRTEGAGILSGNTGLTVLPFAMQQGLCARGAQPPCQGLSGLIVGILAGLLSLAVTLAFGGRLGLHNSLLLLLLVALGWLGGFIWQKTAAFARPKDPRG